MKPVVLVMLPGLDGTSSLFEPLQRELPAWIDSRAVAYPPDHKLGYHELEPLVRAALPADRPFVVLGESFSGPLAVRVAAARPPNLAGVILSCTFVRNPYPVPGWAQGFVGAMSPNFVPHDVRAALSLGAAADGPLRAPMDAALASVSSEVIGHRAASIVGLEDSALLAAVDVPVLYLRASRDLVVPRSAGEWLCRGLKACTVAELDGPHMIQQTNAREAAGVMAAWIESLPAAA